MNLPAGSVRAEDVGSAVRFVIAWGVGALGIKLTDGELNDFTMIAATVVAFALTWLWSRAKNRKLLSTEPPEDAARWKAIAEKYAAAQNLPRPDESRAEYDARVGNPVRDGESLEEYKARTGCVPPAGSLVWERRNTNEAPGSSSRIGPGVGAVLLALTAGVMCAGMVGCQGVGPENRITRADTSLRNGSPVTLQIEDNDKKGVASGTGPARFTSITQDEVQTMQTGTTPRDLFLVKMPDGTVRFNLSSGTDIQAEGLDFDATTGSFRVNRFGTNSSEPIRAGNEAYDRLVAYWTGLSEAQKEARLAEIDALKVTAPELADLILGIVAGL